MEMLTRGKKALKTSLQEHKTRTMPKRVTPSADAKFWCDIGLDKDGFERKFISDEIGYGLFVNRKFKAGEFLLEYVGDRITPQEADERDKKYAKHDSKTHPRCYIYYFRFDGKVKCIDATNHRHRMCRYANDAPRSDQKCNAVMKREVFNNYPRVCLFALKDLKEGEQIMYDYGVDHQSLIWRRKKRKASVAQNESDEDEDNNPFDLPQSESERVFDSESESHAGFTDIDVSDGNDPAYKPKASEYSETTGSTISDTIPDAGRTAFGSFLDRRERPSTMKRSRKAVLEKDTEKRIVALSPHADSLPTTSSVISSNCFIDETAAAAAVPGISGEKTINKQHTSSPVEDVQEESHTTTLLSLGNVSRISAEINDYSVNDKVEAPTTTKQDDICQLDKSSPIEVVLDTSQTAGLSLVDCVPNTPAGNSTMSVPDEKSKSDDALTNSEENNIRHLDKCSPSENVQETSQTTGLRCDICNQSFKTKGALTTHIKSHNKEKKEYKRPPRVCPFCPTFTFHTQLPRHICKKHTDIPAVKEAINLPENSKERNEYFEKFRKEGIFKYNKAQSAMDEPMYLAERQKQNDLICCSNCKGFYGRQLFYRHKATCTKDKTTEPVAIHLDVFSNQDDEFSNVILSCFRRDDVGNLCRNDPIITLIGRRLYQTIKKKPDSIGETRKTVMNDMRLLARLYIFVKDMVPCDTAEALFLRKNFPVLEQAIESVTKEEEKLKHGVKNKIYYLLDSSREILVGHYYSLEMDEKADEIEKFKKLLDLNKSLIFGDAIYAVNMNRQRKLRMPEQMAEEEEVKKLRQYIIATINHLTSELTMVGPHEFVQVRDSICSRLTLFNARRGGEPARLRLYQYEDIKTERWVNSDQKTKLEEWEKKLFQDMEVTYQAGKGTHLVSDFIPLDCRKGLDILADKETRRSAGVPDTNDYIFANTQQSSYHVTGWSAIKKMCEEAKVKNPSLLTATKQRHRISTIYSALEVPESERQYFYKHMGHTREVNVGTYQYPLPVLAMTKVGRHLHDIDEALSSMESVPNVSSGSGCKSVSVDQADGTGVPSTSVEEGIDQSDAVNQAVDVQDSGQTTSANDVKDRQAHDLVKGTPKPACREYFKWTNEETEKIRKDFREWINVLDGNPLPSKAELLDYILSRPGRFNLKQLKTKIMNEQNSQKKLSKMRLQNLMEKK